MVQVCPHVIDGGIHIISSAPVKIEQLPRSPAVLELAGNQRLSRTHQDHRQVIRQVVICTTATAD